ncbi:hypothetical protein RJ55_06775 [Drechmeria coniospora]|nr:hypothetical protein RJ55_06775 [Drechmeria coniospora]
MTGAGRPKLAGAGQVRNAAGGRCAERSDATGSTAASMLVTLPSISKAASPKCSNSTVTARPLIPPQPTCRTYAGTNKAADAQGGLSYDDDDDDEELHDGIDGIRNCTCILACSNMLLDDCHGEKWRCDVPREAGMMSPARGPSTSATPAALLPMELVHRPSWGHDAIATDSIEREGVSRVVRTGLGWRPLDGDPWMETLGWRPLDEGPLNEGSLDEGPLDEGPLDESDRNAAALSLPSEPGQSSKRKTMDRSEQKTWRRRQRRDGRLNDAVAIISSVPPESACSVGASVQRLTSTPLSANPSTWSRSEDGERRPATSNNEASLRASVHGVGLVQARDPDKHMACKLIASAVLGHAVGVAPRGKVDDVRAGKVERVGGVDGGVLTDVLTITAAYSAGWVSVQYGSNLASITMNACM